MAIHSADGLSYFLSLSIEHKRFLGSIRHWKNLKIAFDEDLVWIRDLDLLQVDSVEVKTIPYKEIYYQSGDWLFLRGSFLPHKKVPRLLWSPIQRGLSIELPTFNHNFFELRSEAQIRIVPSTQEKEIYGLLVPMHHFQHYVETAPAIRLKNLSWIVIEDQALILGSPLLPLQGKTFWRRKNFLLPAGFDLELPILADTINELLNEGEQSWIVWEESGNYYKVDKHLFRPLTISSMRLTITK